MSERAKRKRVTKNSHCRYCTFEILDNKSVEVDETNDHLRVNSQTSKVACDACWQKIQDLIASPVEIIEDDNAKV